MITSLILLFLRKNMIKSIIASLLLFLFISCNTTVNSTDIKKITVTSLSEELSKNPIQLVDVRTPEEYNQGHIKNAQLINYFSKDFKKQVQQLNKNKPVYVYCKSGRRSTKAANILHELGFTKIYNLDGGYLNWSKNQPVSNHKK